MTVITRSLHQTQWLRAESELTRKRIYETEEEQGKKKKLNLWNAYLRTRQLLMTAETQACFITVAATSYLAANHPEAPQEPMVAMLMLSWKDCCCLLAGGLDLRL